MKIERIVKFLPAFDKRSPEPSKNYGIGCVRCFMVAKSGDKAVTFSFSTGMFLPSTMDEYIKNGMAKYEIHSWGSYYLNKPIGEGVFYHDTVKHFDDQNPSPKDCEFIGKPCYSDGSFIRGDDVLSVLIRDGDEAVWKILEEDLKELHANTQPPSPLPESRS